MQTLAPNDYNELTIIEDELIKIRDFATKLHHLYKTYLYKAFRILALIILSVPLTILLPFIYYYLSFIMRRACIAIEKIKVDLPNLSMSELDALVKKLDSLSVDKGVTKENIKVLNNTNFLLRPIAFAIKEMLDRLLELRTLAKDEFEFSNKIILQALHTEEDLTLI